MTLPQPAFLIVAMMMTGTGLIFLTLDRRNASTRAISICVIAIGLRVFFSGPEFQPGPPDVFANATFALLEGIAILAGIGWGKRIAMTGTYSAPRWTVWMFWVGQGVVVIFIIMRFVFVIAWPEAAVNDDQGISRISGLEWAIFGPILAVGIVCVAIAITGLRVVQIDAAELVRFQSLSLAGPFLLSALFLAQPLIPITLTIGLLIFLWGSMRYLMLQGKRGQFMRQFLSPEVALMVQTEGMERTLQRQKKILSVVSCDLRGFTAFSRNRPTDDVVELLEQYYELVGEIAGRHGGTIKDHAGDGVLILVGAPVSYEDHAKRAILMSLDIVSEVQRLLSELAPELGVGAGVATGRLTVGAIHGAGRLEYVAVGNPVNLASRLCDRALNGEVLSDRRTIDEASDGAGTEFHFEELAPEPLKGFDEPIPVCGVSVDPLPDGRVAKRRRRKRRAALRISRG